MRYFNIRILKYFITAKQRYLFVGRKRERAHSEEKLNFSKTIMQFTIEGAFQKRNVIQDIVMVFGDNQYYSSIIVPWHIGWLTSQPTMIR